MNGLAEIREDFRFYRTLKPNKGLVSVALDRFFWVSANYRFGRWACRLRIPLIGRLLRLLYVFTNLFVSAATATDIRSGAVIGRRFHVHTSVGIMIADGVVIGDDCTIYAGVGLVNKANGRGEGLPRIGDHVMLGTGCKVLGGVTIGDYAIIGANAVVIRDVPSHHVAVGVPAKNVPIRENPGSRLASRAPGSGHTSVTPVSQLLEPHLRRFRPN